MSVVLYGLPAVSTLEGIIGFPPEEAQTSTVLEFAKKVEGGISTEKYYFFKAYPNLKRGGGDKTSRDVIVPGTMIGSGGGNPPPPNPPYSHANSAIRALQTTDYQGKFLWG